jgi:predicted MPP superfamily phosphohydrolase
MRVVHLSDFHLDKNKLKDMSQFTLKALIKDLKSYHEQKPIDIIAFTGDLIDKGGTSFKDTEEGFFSFTSMVIDPICSELNIHRERFLFVPGNHDINKNLDKKTGEIGLKNALTSTELVNEYIEDNDETGRNRMKPFKEFEEVFYSSISNGEYQLTDFGSSFIIETDKYGTVGISCLNSAWRCYDSSHDKNQIILGERQVTTSLQFIENCDIKIALTHHPLDWLADFEREDIEAIITREYDMLFCGHVHSGSSWSKSGMNNSLFYSIAPANWAAQIRSSDRKYANGYSIIDFNKGEGNITVSHRRYSYRKNSYDPNTDLGDNNGVEVNNIPGSEELRKREFEIDITTHLRSSYCQDINEHLLSYNTDTRAPKSIEEMFVLPRIVRNKQFDLENQDSENIYEFDEICSTTDHLLIMGGKESGKTILLDRILIDLTNNIKNYSKIPVYCKFEEINSARFETIISRFLGVGIHDVNDMLKKHHITLLIDDISFVSSQRHTLKRLETFIEAYNNVTIIATCNSNMGDILLKFNEFPILSVFNSLNIENFKTKEIKALIHKWFTNHLHYDTPEKLNKILNIFSTLNIPRTPLAVSMFLWIIEQQENYKPINNATMLENFIERLFKKQSKNEIYSEKFDYRNKERLLSEIAYEMFRENNINYRITNHELRNFIYRYLKVRKFGFQEDDVLNEFLTCGILVIENDGLWTLAAKVLKNTEETKVEDLKGNSFESIISCSMTFSSIYKMLLMNHLNKDNHHDEEKREKLLLQNRFLPIMHQLEVFYLLGTGKMSIVVREAIEKKIYDENISDYEKFINVFLYADLQEKDYMKYISQLIKNVKRTYIYDMLLFKVVSYYYLRSKNKTTDNQFENFLGDIRVRASKLDKLKKKSDIIEDYRKRRKQMNDDEDNGYALDA